MKVKAKELGFDGIQLRQEGEVFSVDPKRLTNWMEPLEAVEPKPQPLKAKEVESDDEETNDEPVKKKPGRPRKVI